MTTMNNNQGRERIIFEGHPTQMSMEGAAAKIVSLIKDAQRWGYGTEGVHDWTWNGPMLNVHAVVEQLVAGRTFIIKEQRMDLGDGSWSKVVHDFSDFRRAGKTTLAIDVEQRETHIVRQAS
jgi:hypothetical protein